VLYVTSKLSKRKKKQLEGDRACAVASSRNDGNRAEPQLGRKRLVAGDQLQKWSTSLHESTQKPFDQMTVRSYATLMLHLCGSGDPGD
jgi:hypothetical protein